MRPVRFKSLMPSLFLYSAARQLGDVLREGLGGELQSLDRRQVREDRLRELLHGVPTLDRECRSLDAVGTFGRQDVGTEQLPFASVRNELDQSPRVTRGDGP